MPGKARVSPPAACVSHRGPPPWAAVAPCDRLGGTAGCSAQRAGKRGVKRFRVWAGQEGP